MFLQVEFYRLLNQTGNGQTENGQTGNGVQDVNFENVDLSRGLLRNQLRMLVPHIATNQLGMSSLGIVTYSVDRYDAAIKSYKEAAPEARPAIQRDIEEILMQLEKDIKAFYDADELGFYAGVAHVSDTQRLSQVLLLIVSALLLVLFGGFISMRIAERRMGRRLRHHALAQETANRELETFSYSVSHDLRGPLVAVGGFSEILLRDYDAVLDDTGCGYLRHIRTGAQRMARIIDSLLDLSRVSLGELRREPVSLSSAARSVMEDLATVEPGRQVENIIRDGVMADGDPQLLRILLSNLLGNAWKFTGKQPNPIIEFGVSEGGDSPVYYVRDNGAGFDMELADRLFGAFQRLHSPEEFQGTGIGLATVQRIVLRHGGRIWAQSEVGKGTVFYFTLE